MSNPEIELRVTETAALGGRVIAEYPIVQSFSRSQKAMKPAHAALYQEKDGKKLVYIEYTDSSGAKWVTLESLQQDNNNAIRVLLGGATE